jgi:hypothetical protein
MVAEALMIFGLCSGVGFARILLVPESLNRIEFGRA